MSWRSACKRASAGDPRLIVEDKGAPIALHFRLAPDARGMHDTMRSLSAPRGSR